MKVEVHPDAEAVARRGASWLAETARQAIAARGRFLLAVSGGRTPGLLLRALAAEELPWKAVHVLQVDERVAAAGSGERNLTQLRANLLDRVALPAANLHALPVNDARLEAAAAAFAESLTSLAGSPAILDVVQLGLGSDGHTASLVPGDAALEVTDRDVTCTGTYAGTRRMTLTYPALDRARHRLWIVTGEDKRAVVPRLVAGDPTIPAGRVRGDAALLLCDVQAAAEL